MTARSMRVILSLCAFVRSRGVDIADGSCLLQVTNTSQRGAADKMLGNDGMNQSVAAEETYIMITTNGMNQYIQLSEVEAYDNGGGKITPTNAIISPVYDGVRSPGSNCIDGKIQQTRDSWVGYTCISQAKHNAYLKITYPLDAEFATFKAYNRVDCCSDRLSNMRFKVFKRGTLVLDTVFSGTRHAYDFSMPTSSPTSRILPHYPLRW